MRSPNEIKKGLECCQLAFGFRECGSRCPYYRDSSCGALLAADALALIQQLEARAHQLDLLNVGLLVEKAQLEAEREALSEELKNAHSCFACKKFRRNGGNCCGGSVCMMRDFEWRGVQKEEAK